MTNPQSSWRRIPLFIASTFRDVDHKRDVLTSVVIPAVNAQLRQRGHGASIYPVDVPWGNETDERLDPETRQRMILDICVSEVRRTDPLFLGLLGAKYGWIPRSSSAGGGRRGRASRSGFPLSVTAIQILAAIQAAHTNGIQPILFAGGTAAADQDEQERLGRLAIHLSEQGLLAHRYDIDSTFTDLATATLLDPLSCVRDTCRGAEAIPLRCSATDTGS